MEWLIGQNSMNEDASRWLIYGMIALAVAYLVLRPMMKRRRDPLDGPTGLGNLARHRTVERQMETLLVDLTEMARQVTAQLDTRSAKLEALIRQADERIASLRGGIAGGLREPVNDDQRGESCAAEAIPDPRHAEVYALADQGRAAREIAAALNRPSGEVELILALRRQEQ
jgi:hypothetical protein